MAHSYLAIVPMVWTKNYLFVGIEMSALYNVSLYYYVTVNVVIYVIHIVFSHCTLMPCYNFNASVHISECCYNYALFFS